jgi:hypothetical protein
MSPGAKPIRILAVDDHPIFGQGIAALLANQADMSLVAEAANGYEAIQQFRVQGADITPDGLADAGDEWLGCDDRHSQRIHRRKNHRIKHLC